MNLSTVSKSSDDIKIFMWNNFYIWCLITLLFFIFKYYFANGFYSYFFLIIIFLRGFKINSNPSFISI
ncbi:hypothetical protein ACOES3_03110, partial [Candidatus Phytoplasma citri]